MRRARILHHLGVTALVATIVAAAASLWPTDARPGASALGAVTVVRDLLAFTGAASIGGAVLGAPLGWVMPSAWAILPALLRTSSSSQDEILSLVVQPDDSFAALVTAVLAWLIGLVVAGGDVSARGAAHGASTAVMRARVRFGGRRGLRAR